MPIFVRITLNCELTFHGERHGRGGCMRMKTREIHTIHKKITLFASLLFLCCFNSACLFRSYLEEATEYVQEHEDEIRRLIEEHEENDPEGARFRSHTEDWAYAEFVLGGISMGDGSIFGIYYTEEDQPWPASHWSIFYSEWDEVGEYSYKAYDLSQYGEDMT